MKILIVTQYFWPEFFVINQVAKELTEQGCSVDVYTGKPNYPKGEIYKGYTQNGLQREVFENKVNIFRAPLRARGRSGVLNLAKNYLSFIVNGLRYFPKESKGKKYDVIFFFGTSPLTSIIPAIFLKHKLNAHLCCWVQDLCPDSLSATGYIKNKLIIRFFGFITKLIYSQCDTILMQSKSFIEQLKKYTDTEKVFYFPNTLDGDSILLLNEFIDIPNNVTEVFQNKFNIVFTGNIGNLQSFETVVDAVKLIDRRIQIVVIGDGSRFDWLVQQQKKYKIDNLIILGRYRFELMSYFFKAADALLITLKADSNNLNYLSLVTPGKIQAYMAAGKPIIASIDGDGKNTIIDADCGLVSDAENVDMLVNNIHKIYKMSSKERCLMGKRGRIFFDDNFEIRKQVKKLIELLSERI